MESNNENVEICCPQIEPEKWEDIVFNWEHKLFVRDKVFTFFYMPLNFGRVMKRLDNQIRNSGSSMPDCLCLSDHTSKWNMDVYLAVDKAVAGGENTTLSGKFLSKIYEGPYSNTGKWCKDYENYARSKGMNIKKWYMWYTTCPKCAKKYGKNYVVIMSQVEDVVIGGVQ